MKRYAFPLDPVLRVRRIAEDQAKSAFAVAEMQRAEAEQVAARRLAAHRAPQPGGSSMSATSFLAAREQHERTADALLGAQRDARAADVAAEATRRSLIAARGAVTALEKLDERRREEHAKEVLRQETVEADDLVTGRRRRRDR